MTTPRPLSAAAQAVLDAAEQVPVPHGQTFPLIRLEIAAAIRALVEQVAVIAPAGDRVWSEGQAASYAAITTAVRRMQSIAAELHGGPAHHPRRPPMSTLETNPTPTAPDWRALCQGLLQAIDDDVIDANDGPRFQAVVDRTRAALATPPAAPDTTRENVKAAVADALGGSAYDCLRVWSAWGIGTMGQDDFSPIAEDDDRVAEIADAAIAALATPPAATREAGPEVRPTLRSLLHPAYEPGDGSADGAQLVDEQWWHPIMGCDSLQEVADNARDLFSRGGGAVAPAVVELPPRPPMAHSVDRFDLVRYGVTWDGSKDKPLLSRRPDGYWTPWHIAAQLPQPVPVSERLPGPEDCDSEDRCWLCGKVEGDWRLMSVANPGVPHLKYCFSHWLPHWALPVPAAAGDR